MARICLYCGSRPGFDPGFADLAVRFGEQVARGGHTLIYGGGSIGLMGLAARAARGAGGTVIGIIPQFLKDLEVAETGLSELIIVDTMHARKWRMLELSDVIVALPGGIGTLDELVEAITWAQLKLHTKPIWLLSETQFWDPLLSLLHHYEATGFAHDGLTRQFQTIHSLDAFLAALQP